MLLKFSLKGWTIVIIHDSICGLQRIWPSIGFTDVTLQVEVWGTER